MYERFNEKAIKTIMLAQEEARRLGHNFIGTEMILLGLVGEGTAIPAKLFKEYAVTLKDSRTEVEKIIGRGSGFISVEIPFTPRGKKVLQLSWDSARELGHNYIGPEHLLLGVIKEGEGVAARVLENLGLELPKLKQDVLKAVVDSGALKQPSVSTVNWIDVIIDKVVLERTELARELIKHMVAKQELKNKKEIEAKVTELVNRLIDTI